MEFEFDKEMDSLLRQMAKGGAAENRQSATVEPHLDADEISAFAENALPEKTKQKYILHLADCDNCRKNLSYVIALNTDAESEIIRAKEKEIIAAPIPWYRKFFAFPNLAYTMGALVLIFSGITIYTVLQNVSGSPNAEVSQISEKQPNGKGMSSDGDAPMVETYSNKAMSNSASMNSSAANGSASVSNSMIASAPSAMMNSNAAMRDESNRELKSASKPAEVQSTPTDLAKTENSITAGAPPPSPMKENNSQTDDEFAKQQPNIAQQNLPMQNQTQITPDSRNARRSAPSATLQAEPKDKKLAESRNDAREKSIETISVGGKIFNRQNGVSIDSAYRGQATTNITRGTKEYKKLDKDLRRIVENLGGTVIIVWKENAYRIQ